MDANRKSRTKRYLMMLAVFVLSVAGAYGYGRWQGAQAAAGAQAQAADYREDAAASAIAAEREMAQLRGRNEMLQARRRLHLALMALDERNFGTARGHLVAASGNLSAVQDLPPGADTTALAHLAKELQSARLIATEDFAEQRNRISGWVRELDAQFPAEAAAAAAPDMGPAAPGGEGASAAPGATESTSAPPGTAAAPPGPR
jgi:hypothetical protein